MTVRELSTLLQSLYAYRPDQVRRTVYLFTKEHPGLLSDLRMKFGYSEAEVVTHLGCSTEKTIKHLEHGDCIGFAHLDHLMYLVAFYSELETNSP